MFVSSFSSSSLIDTTLFSSVLYASVIYTTLFSSVLHASAEACRSSGRTSSFVP